MDIVLPECAKEVKAIKRKAIRTSCEYYVCIKMKIKSWGMKEAFKRRGAKKTRREGE
jgi:hypothetical protein